MGLMQSIKAPILGLYIARVVSDGMCNESSQSGGWVPHDLENTQHILQTLRQQGWSSEQRTSFRGTSLFRNRAPLGPYKRSRALRWSYGSELFLMGEVSL